MEAVPETKQAKRSSQSLASSLALAFDHCPSVLFAFLSDNEAARVARALCVPQLLSTKRYDIKRELPAHAAVAGLFPGVVRSVVFNSSKVEYASQWRGRVVDLPRSLTRLVYTHDDIGVVKPEDWPASLTSLELPYLSKPLSTPLPSTLRVLVCNTDLSPSLVLPDSLTTLRSAFLGRPVSQLPSNLTTLSMHLPKEVKPKDLVGFPISLTHLTVHRMEPVQERYEVITLNLPPLLRALRLEFVPLRILGAVPEPLEELTIIGDMPVLDSPFRHARLRKLVLPHEFDQPIRASDFPSLQVLSLGYEFIHPLDDLPPSLSELTVCGSGVVYDHDLDRLPASLTRLTLEQIIERPLDKLPPSLRILALRFSINHDLDHLPDSLTELCLLGSHFNKPLDRLPRQLKMLALSEDFNRSLDALPDGLTRLNLQRSHAFHRPLDHLPDSLQELLLPATFNHPFPRLPPGLQVLRFPFYTDFNHPLDHLPESLSDLRLGDRFNQPFRRLPRGLTRLSLSRDYNHPLPISPESIPDYKASLHSDITYPTALRSLTLGDGFNHRLSLPPSLTELTLTPWSRVPLSVASLPEHLMALELPFDTYPQLIDLEALRKRCPLLQLQDNF